MLPIPQIPKGDTGVPTPPLVQAVVRVPHVPPPGALERDLEGEKLLTRLVVAQVQGQNVVAPSTVREEVVGSRVCDFLHMNPLVCTGSNVTEDP